MAPHPPENWQDLPREIHLKIENRRHQLLKIVLVALVAVLLALIYRADQESFPEFLQDETGVGEIVMEPDQLIGRYYTTNGDTVTIWAWAGDDIEGDLVVWITPDGDSVRFSDLEISHKIERNETSYLDNVVENLHPAVYHLPREGATKAGQTLELVPGDSVLSWVGGETFHRDGHRLHAEDCRVHEENCRHQLKKRRK